MHTKLWLIKFVLLIQTIQLGESIPVDEDLLLTFRERVALDKFRSAVKNYVPHEYMTKDIYLIRFLRARKLNIEAAETMLKNSLHWRNQNKIDSIVYEDFSDMKSQFPSSIDAVDNTGRPVLKMDASEWDVRKAVVSGKSERLIRYIYQLVETTMIKIREAQDAGQNVTQGTTIVNLDGFNLIQHACAQCIAIYVNFVMVYENNYPGMVHKIVLINTPASFEIVLQAVRPVMSADTKRALTVFGTRKDEWKKFLLSMISPDQLEPQFGGFKYPQIYQ